MLLNLQPGQKRVISISVRRKIDKYLLKFVLTFALFIAWVVGLELNALAIQGEISIEGFGGSAFGPRDTEIPATLDFGFGGGAGVGYEVIDSHQIRMESGFYRWSKALSDGPAETIDEKLYNMQIFLGERHFFQLNRKISPFLDFGLSANFLELKKEQCFGGCGPYSSVSTRAIRFGVSPGIGARFTITRHLDLGAVFRYNFVQTFAIGPDFMSLSLFAAYRF